MSQQRDQHLACPIEPASITWNAQQTPVSAYFGDVYYSTDNGLAESHYVFLQHNRLPDRWHELCDHATTCFTIAETGFGTGLNFLATLQAWQQTPLENARLHYLSVEKYPLSPQDLQRALQQWPQLNGLSEQLIANYPPLVPGFHRIDLPDLRVHLTLVFGDMLQALPQLQATVNAWYLDGFAPNKNPQMWQTELFHYMQHLSSSGTSYATFTAAGAVRRELAKAGFSVNKVKGYGHKREMIAGELVQQQTGPSALPADQEPWYRPKKIAGRHHPIRSAIVIGAGLAGCYSANALARRGIKVTVLEQHDQIAQEASGNPAGITFTRLSAFDSPQNRFYQKAYLYAADGIARQLEHSDLRADTDYRFNGVFRFAFNEKERDEQQKLLASGLWPADMATSLSATGASELLGFPCRHGGLLIHKGGWLTPAELCRINLDHELIQLHANSKAENLAYNGQQWQVATAEKTHCGDALILANGFGANQFPGLEFLPLRSVRGQITYLPGTRKSEQALRHALNYEGYITPAKNGFHCVGATFHPKSTSRDFSQEDHQTNLRNLAATIPELYEMLMEEDSLGKSWPLTQGRVAFRCQSPDYLPMIGPVPDLAQFKLDYADLRKGFLKKAFPLGSYLPQCYVNVAHGSRGITSAFLGAEIIAGYLNNEPQPIDNQVLEAIHPARFPIRGLKRNKI